MAEQVVTTSIRCSWETKRRLDRVQRLMAARLDQALTADETIGRLVDMYEAASAQGLVTP